jgi:TolB-like protein
MSLNSNSVMVHRARNIPSLRPPMPLARMRLSSVEMAGCLHSGIFLVILVTFVASCATKPVSYEEDTTVAAWDLENLSPMESGHADLGQLLSAKVIETLKETGRHTVVERERLLLALEELSLGTTSLVDETTRLRIGRIVGARLMIFGAYQVIADKMRLDLRLVEVETGSILKAAQKTTSAEDLSGWLRAAREATTELF